MVPALILAAGESKRMGRSKALLPHTEDDTFTSYLTRSLRAGGADDVLVVGRSSDRGLQAEAARCGARFIDNPHADRGQLSSLIAGLDIVDRPGVVAVLVMPVDIPLVRSDTIRRALAAFHATRAPIVRVTHENRHGHPVIFGRAVFDELRRADYDIGAKAVLQLHAATILNVEVDDPAVLRDVDTPEDYQAIFARPPEE